MERAPFVSDEIDAIVFDVIGTLVDEDETWARVSARLATEAGIPGPDAPEKLHERWAELLDERMDAVIAGDATWQPHGRLVSDSAREAISGLGGTPSPATSARVEFVEREYPAWPDVADATAALRRHRLVAGVSNGDLDTLARLANTNSISWDIALSTSAVQTFKPAPAAYRYAIEQLGIDPARTLFVAAHPWDLRAAAQHGFRTAYIARPGAEKPSPDDRFDLDAPDLSALPSLLAR
jgi:2-haloacid dehalogenase